MPEKISLSGATTFAEILAAAQQYVWWKDHETAELPLNKALSVAQFLELLSFLPAQACADACDCVAALASRIAATHGGDLQSDPAPGWVGAWRVPAGEHLDATVGRDENMLVFRNRASGEVSVESAHAPWKQLPEATRPEHPIESLVRACFARSAVTKRLAGALTVVPTDLFPRPPRHVYVEHRSDVGGDLGWRTTGEQLELLEGEYVSQTSIAVPVLGGTAAPTSGRGASLEKRLAFFRLTDIDLKDREAGVIIPRVTTLRDLTEELKPSGYRASRDGEPIMRALKRLPYAVIRMPDGREFAPVTVREYPNPADQSSEVRFELMFSSELARRGPRVSRSWLIEDGAISDPAFDLCLGLFYLWDEGKRAAGYQARIYAERPAFRRDREGNLVDEQGKVITAGNRGEAKKHPKTGRLFWPPGDHPVKDWRHPDAVPSLDLNGHATTERHPFADRVPELGPEQRRKLAYGPVLNGTSPSQRWNETKQADKRLLARARRVVDPSGNPVELGTNTTGEPVFEHWYGRYVIEQNRGGGWRILEEHPALRSPAAAEQRIAERLNHRQGARA